MGIEINVERFLASFKYMGLGMLSIFIVIGLIIGTVLLLTLPSVLKARAAKKKEEEKMRDIENGRYQ